MVKELLVNQNYEPELFEYAEKPLRPGEVRVKTVFGAPKHGTELTDLKVRPFEENYYDEEAHIFRQRDQIQSGVRGSLGNMWVGLIEEIGKDVRGFAVGERVAGYGALANTHTVGASELLKLPERISAQEAVCYDPLQFAMGGLRDANLRIGDAVLVSGLGAIGQMAAQAARLAGASRVYVSDPIEVRRRVALENGADRAFDPTKEDMGAILRELTHQNGVDVVIETSANYKAIEQCLRALGYRGNMAFVGWFKECRVPFTLGREGHFNQQNIFFSRACSEPNRDYPRWDFARICREAWELICSGKFHCGNVVFPVVSFETCDKAYDHYIIKHPEESIKMGVEF